MWRNYKALEAANRRASIETIKEGKRNQPQRKAMKGRQDGGGNGENVLE